jgi:hypothetical protein
MSNTNTGGPAFPNEGFNGWGSPQEGMTLRDYFAIHATNEDVTRHIGGPMVEEIQTDMQGRKMIVNRPIRRNREQARFAFADAMLKARES